MAGKSLAHPHTPIFPRTWVIRLWAVEIPKPHYVFYLSLSIRSLSVTVVSYIIRPSSDISHHSVIRTTPVDYEYRFVTPHNQILPFYTASCHKPQPHRRDKKLRPNLAHTAIHMSLLQICYNIVIHISCCDRFALYCGDFVEIGQE